MSLVKKLMRELGIDRDIANYVAKHAKRYGHSEAKARQEAAKWQECRDNGQVTVTEHGIHGSRPNDPATRHLWEDIA